MLPLIFVYGSSPGVQQIQRVDTSVGPELHHFALKDLDGKAIQPELVGDRIAERANAAAVLEEIPECIVVDAEIGLREKARI